MRRLAGTTGIVMAGDFEGKAAVVHATVAYATEAGLDGIDHPLPALCVTGHVLHG